MPSKIRRLYSITCELCGRERPSSRRPGTPWTPKVCTECNLERERERLARLFKRPVLPAEYPRRAR